MKQAIDVVALYQNQNSQVYGSSVCHSLTTGGGYTRAGISGGCILYRLSGRERQREHYGRSSTAIDG